MLSFEYLTRLKVVTSIDIITVWNWTRNILYVLFCRWVLTGSPSPPCSSNTPRPPVGQARAWPPPFSRGRCPTGPTTSPRCPSTSASPSSACRSRPWRPSSWWGPAPASPPSGGSSRRGTSTGKTRVRKFLSMNCRIKRGKDKVRKIPFNKL